MNLLDLAVKIGVKDEASDKISGITEGAIARASAMGQAMYDATKFVATKAVDMVSGFAKSAIEGYGDFEQMKGGIEKLYGDAADTVIANSEKAFREAGMNQNQYLQASTTLAASLIKSLGGDMDAAAERNATAMKAIADNADTFGTSVEDVSAVYTSLSKGMYQTLDNLYLGYAGTKTGMEQLIADANEYAESIGESSDMTIDSFADIVRAIDLIQQKEGIAGTTAKEAMTTIQGSLRMLRNGWSDFVAAVGSGDIERIQETMDEVRLAIFGQWDEELEKRTGGVINNVLPVVENVGKALVGAIPQLAGSVSYAFMEMLANALGVETDVDDTTEDLAERIVNALRTKISLHADELAEAASELVVRFAEGVAENAPFFIERFSEIIAMVIEQLPTLAEGFVEGGATIVTAITEGFANSAPNLVQTIVETFTEAGSQASTSFSEAFQTLGEIGMDFLAGVPERLEVLQGVIDASLKPALDNLGEAFNNVVQALEPWMPAIENVITLVAGTFIDVFAALINILSTVMNAIAAVIGWLHDFGTDIMAAGDIIADCIAKAGEDWNRLPEDIKGALDTAINAVTSWASGMVEKATQAMSDFLSAVQQKGSEVTTWFAELPSSIISALGDVGSLLYNSGVNLIQGFVNGVTSMVGSLISSVSGALSAGITAGKEILGINSPSKVFYGFGLGTIEGYVNALNDSEKNVRDAVSRVMDFDVNQSIGVTTDVYGQKWQQASAAQVGNGTVYNNYYIDAHAVTDERVASAVLTIVNQAETFREMGVTETGVANG